MMNTFTTAFNRDKLKIGLFNSKKFAKPSKVKASLSYAVDINSIYENYARTGRLPLNGNSPIYDENFVKYDSLIEAQKLLDSASLYFNNLPANIRKQYGNNLGEFVKGIHQKDDFLIKNGVLKLSESDVKPVEKPVENQGPVSPAPQGEKEATGPSARESA